MMYEILIDGKVLYYPGDELCTVIDPEIVLKMNDSGTAKMKVPSTNPYYDSILLRKSMITVKKNDREVFYGEVRAYTGNMGLERQLTAVGALSFLSDSRQPQRNWGKMTPLQFLTGALDNHNQQMFDDERKKIYVGYVTVSNTLNAGAKITDNNSTLDAIRENLLSVHGGVLRLRHENNKLYLDYVNLSEYGNYCNQVIQLGDNIMDYTENFNAEGVKTVVIPLGAKIDDDTETEFETRVDIRSVNEGKNYIVGANTAVDNYGYIWTTVTYDSITDPANLKTMGQTYLRETQFERATFKLSAVDLSAVDSSIDTMYFGDRVNIQADIFGLNATYPIVEMTMKPQKPEDERIVMSANLRSKKVTLTGRVTSSGHDATIAAKREALKMETVIRSEIANIMATFAGQYGGYKLSEFDSNGLWVRDLYMDAPDKTQATNIMEFSMRGIRFSTAGYKPPTDPAWTLALSINGKIATDEIFSNIIFANLLKVGIIEDVDGKTSWNLETGDWRSKTNYSGEYLQILNGIIKGFYNNTLIGYLDFSANIGNAQQCVLGSKNVLNLEFTTQVNFLDARTNTVVATVDGNGIHGQGLDGWVNIGDQRVRLDNGLIMEVI